MCGGRSIRPPLTIAHLSDVHLGLDHNPALAAECFHRALEAVRRSRAAALLVVGDLFDHNRVSQETVEATARGLCALGMPVVLLPGNHDCYDETSVYRRVELESLCPNARVIREEDGETLCYPHLGLKLWGRPVVDHEPAFQPLAGMPAPEGDWWHVALAHGIYVSSGWFGGRSSPITAQEIAAAGWDYLALGHHHVFEEVSQNGTRACYSGSPMGPGYGETGGDVLLVSFAPGQPPTVERCALGAGALPPGR